MEQPPDEVRSRLWIFVRGDSEPRSFARWAYADRTLEERLGAELYLTLIDTDYEDGEAVWSLRTALGAHLRSGPPSPCLCHRLRNLDVVDMGTFNAPSPAFEQDRGWSHEDVMHAFADIRQDDNRWWRSAARCTACHQAWLIGADSRHHDVFCLKRLDDAEAHSIEESDQWPHDFATYEQLLRICVRFGHIARHADPLDPGLVATIADLATARPGIKTSELAHLLQVSPPHATTLAQRAQINDALTITFDDPTST